MHEIKRMMRRRHFPRNVLIRSEGAQTWVSYRNHVSGSIIRRMFCAITYSLGGAGLLSLLDWAGRSLTESRSSRTTEQNF